MSKTSDVAKTIKQELSEKYPGIKFSVLSDIFQEGDSASISWVDGPSIEHIEDITAKYQSDKDTPKTVKFINVYRNMSSKTEDEIVKELQKRYKECEGKDRDAFIDGFKASMRQLIWREFYDRSY